MRFVDDERAYPFDDCGNKRVGVTWLSADIVLTTTLQWSKMSRSFMEVGRFVTTPTNGAVFPQE